MDSFGFIIPSYCSSEIHLLQLKRCLDSIKKFHPEKQVIVIDDYSDVNLSENLKAYENVKIIISPIKSAGDMVTYKVFKDNPLFKKAIIIQDSMVLEKPLVEIENIKSISYIWYFTNHRLHWHKIKEPQTEYNKANGIRVHDDAVIDTINRFVTKEDFKKYALDMFMKKDKWSGCFGCLSIVDYDFIDVLNGKTGIVDLLTKMNDNRLRRVAESLFAISCLYVLGEEVFEKAYDGLYYDGIKPARNTCKIRGNELGFPNNIIINQVCKNDYISKVSFDRRPIKTN
jgi:hypothetical protein